MAWTYRNDRSDETYHAPGVMLVEGEKLPHTPTDAEHAKDMLDPKRVEKREKEAAEQEEKVKAGKAPTKEDAAAQLAKDEQMHRDRQKIRLEEQTKIENEEREKELEKMRKEEHDKLQKSRKEEAPTAANKK